MNIDQKHFLIMAVMILFYLAMLLIIMYLDLSVVIMAAMSILLWAFSEYHHRVIMYPLILNEGVISGKLQMLNKFKKDLEVKHGKKKA